MSDLGSGLILPLFSGPGAPTQESPNFPPNKPGLSLVQLSTSGPSHGSHWWKHKLSVSIRTVIFKCTWLLITDITYTHLLYLLVANAVTPFLARKIHAAVLRYSTR